MDDAQFDQEDSEADVLLLFPRAAFLILKMLKEELKADVAEDKASLVSSSPKLAQKFRLAVGEAAGHPAEIAKNEGVGESQEDHGQAVHEEAQVDQGSEGGIPAEDSYEAATTRPKKTAKTNIILKSMYGAQVEGLDKMELPKSQRMAAAHLPPLCGGSSCRRTLLSH